MAEDQPARLIEGVRIGRNAKDRPIQPDPDDKASYWARVKRLSKEEKRA